MAVSHPLWTGLAGPRGPEPALVQPNCTNPDEKRENECTRKPQSRCGRDFVNVYRQMNDESANGAHLSKIASKMNLIKEATRSKCQRGGGQMREEAKGFRQLPIPPNDIPRHGRPINRTVDVEKGIRTKSTIDPYSLFHSRGTKVWE